MDAEYIILMVGYHLEIRTMEHLGYFLFLLLELMA